MRLVSLGLLSGSSLFLEIALTRLLSSLYFPPYVFAVISLAILGIGLGAAAATWRNDFRNPAKLPLYMALAGLSTLALVCFTALTASVNLGILLFVFLTLPYIFVGLALATIFSTAPQNSTQFYMADLVGAGLGAALVIPVLNSIGAIDAALAAAIGFGLSGALLQPMHRLSSGFLAAAVIVVGSNVAGSWLTVDMAALHTDKPIKASLADSGTIIETRWDAFARTDLIDPGSGSPYQLFVDGAAGSIMPPLENFQPLLGDIGFFPFATAQPRRVMIIGPGGGLDVWFALFSQAAEIVAVEVNPASVDLVREYADYNGHLYEQRGVQILVDEGRSVLKRDDSRYDLIYLAQVITETSERSGYALTENTIYTVEAFTDYLDHLTLDGEIALKLYDELTLTRAMSLAVAALREQGASDADAMQHIMAFLDTRTQPPIPLLIVGKSPFSRDDSLAHGAVAQEVGFIPLFLPGGVAEPPLAAVASGDMTFDEVIADSEADISAPTDDRPFFFQFERGIPGDLATLVWGMVGVAVVGGGALVYRQRKVDNRLLRWSPLYFAALGMGFINIEMAVIQQTRVFLGHPTLAITTVIVTFLIGGGTGSLLAGRWIDYEAGIIPAVPPVQVVVVMIAWLLLWSGLSEGLLESDLTVRMLVVILTVLPLALVMGMPFPLGLRVLGDDQHIALAWAVNGITTVIGSVGAVALSILAGFSAVFYAGIILYVLAAAFAYLIQQKT